MAQDPQEDVGADLTASANRFLRTHPISGRRSSRNVLSIIDSMKRNGWIGPPIPVVNYAGEIYVLDGHHRLVAARMTGTMVRYRLVDVGELASFNYDSIDQVVMNHAEAGPNRLRLK